MTERKPKKSIQCSQKEERKKNVFIIKENLFIHPWQYHQHKSQFSFSFSSLQYNQQQQQQWQFIL
jgi:hypothetical protein